MLSKIIKSKFFIFVACLLLFLVVISFGKELQSRYQINREIKTLEQEIAKLESENQNVSQLINYFKTTEFQERQARLLLNLQKPGEFAVALPQKTEERENTAAIKNTRQEASNFAKWFRYFFQSSK